jgi:hypothetical protein
MQAHDCTWLQPGVHMLWHQGCGGASWAGFAYIDALWCTAGHPECYMPPMGAPMSGTDCSTSSCCALSSSLCSATSSTCTAAWQQS